MDEADKREAQDSTGGQHEAETKQQATSCGAKSGALDGLDSFTGNLKGYPSHPPQCPGARR